MPVDSEDAITQTLVACSLGDREAWERLTPLIYSELRRLAAGYLRRERSGHTLQPTALLNEAYIRLVEQRLPKFASRSQFYGLAAQVMRQILVDSARSHKAQKRGDGAQRVPLELAALEFGAAPGWDVLELDTALLKLAEGSQVQAQAIELHYFAGLTLADMAPVTGRSERTLARQLRAGKLFLARELGARERGLDHAT